MARLRKARLLATRCFGGPPAQVHLVKLCPRGLGALLAVVLVTALLSLPYHRRLADPPPLLTSRQSSTGPHTSTCRRAVCSSSAVAVPFPPQHALALVAPPAAHDRPRAHALFVAPCSSVSSRSRHSRRRRRRSFIANCPLPASSSTYRTALQPVNQEQRANRPFLCPRPHPDQATAASRRDYVFVPALLLVDKSTCRPLLETNL